MNREFTSLSHEYHPAAKGSFDSSRLPITKIIIHTMDGTFLGTRAWFANEKRSNLTSTHYGVSFEGKVDCYVMENKTAYGAGNYAINQQCINIEFEDKGDPNIQRPDQLYKVGGALIKDICEFYQLPINDTTIEPHRKYSTNKTCPGTLDLNRLMAIARGEAGQVAPDMIQIEKQLFEKLIKESRNFKEVWSYLLLPEAQMSDPVAYQTVTKYIDTLRFERKYWEDEHNRVLESLQVARPSVPQDTSSSTPTLTLPEQNSSQSPTLLDELGLGNKTVSTGKNLLAQDVSNGLKWFFTKIFG